ncbi:uncharacterized protein LOC123011865 [Tribolium madens]|uniref:uncharacterized protein LOC123011865 n=1 Tax=Tribolium madens TaxID=41895 RepID=UPI001CF74E8F|nr:uncharacterized protein LOC123011865 [Tribolium madens]
MNAAVVKVVSSGTPPYQYEVVLEKFQRHGILMFDEIQVRESVSVNSKKLTYVGLSDFGNDMLEKHGLDFNEKATHALVFMFQSLADRYTQPIGVFASKGPVDGTTLAQLIIKAVVLLEKAGAYVHAFIADGALTNRMA